MAVPSELSLAEIRNFMLKSGGKVTNHELVKHFKQFLTHPDTKGKWSLRQRCDKFKPPLVLFGLVQLNLFVVYFC